MIFLILCKAPLRGPHSPDIFVGGVTVLIGELPKATGFSKGIEIGDDLWLRNAWIPFTMIVALRWKGLLLSKIFVTLEKPKP